MPRPWFAGRYSSPAGGEDLFHDPIVVAVAVFLEVTLGAVAA
jgi:hypothetical protein